MKSIGLAVLLSCFALTSLATATNSVDFSNGGGTLAGTSAGLTLSGSTLISVIGLNGGGMVTGNLGTVSFSTGALASGSLDMGGTFATGGMFSINGNGTNGIPNGVLFSGTFSAPVTWVLTTLMDGTHSYTLTGVMTGMMGGNSVNGVTVQLTVNTGTGLFTGSARISGGDTIVTSVPEPSTLALFAGGTMSMVGMMRRKLFAR
jgi:PEP-CTERM motif